MRCKVAFAIAMALTTATAAANEVVNGGFETGTLAGWTATFSPPNQVSAGAYTPRIGSYSARLISPQADTGGARLSQILDPPVPVAEMTQFSFYVQGFNYNYVFVYYADNFRTLQYPISGMWRQVDLLRLLDPSHSVARLEFFTDHSAHVESDLWIDEVDIERVPEPATTGLFLIGLLLCRPRAAL